jgi:hypothetical protein
MRELLGVSLLIGKSSGVHTPEPRMLWCLPFNPGTTVSYIISFLCRLSFWKIIVLFCSRIRKRSSWIWELWVLIILPGLFCRNLKLIFTFLFWVWFNILIYMPSVGALQAVLITRKSSIKPHRGSCYQLSSPGLEGRCPGVICTMCEEGPSPTHLDGD